MSNIDLNDYMTIGFISKNQNPVLKVQYIKNKKEYALKKIKRFDLKIHLKDIQGVLHVQNCDHPNILKILGFYILQQKNNNQTEYVLFLLMNCYEKTLESEILERKNKNNHYKKDEFLKLIKDLYSALYYLQNDAKIAHRDIKPSNILISEQGSLLLSDFSESYLQTSFKARSTSIVGSPYFMAPELKELYIISDSTEEINYDPWKADVYSMGMTLLDCACLSIAENGSIEKKLKIIEEIYGDDIKDFIAICLKSEEKERFDFIELGKCKEYEKIYGDIFLENYEIPPIVNSLNLNFCYFISFARIKKK